MGEAPGSSRHRAVARSRPAPGLPRLLWLVVAVTVVYAFLWWLGQGPLDQVYTAEWASRRIVWFYAPATLVLAALSRRVVPTVLSTMGLVFGVVVGELVGGYVLAVQDARLERELATGVLQSWQPTHHGWWIASLVFVGLTAVGAFLAWRSAHRGS